MNSAPAKSTRSSLSSASDSSDSSTANESINFRLARYLDHVRNLETENTQRCLKEADSRLAEQQEHHANALQELRDQYESHMRANRDKMENLLETKVKTAEKASQRDKEALNDALKTLAAAYNRIDDCNSKVNVLEQINSSLHDRCRNLQNNLVDEQALSAKLQTEVNRLREEMALKVEEYQNEMDAEESISSEIAAFDTLLTQAEKRLRMSTANSAIGICKTTSY